LDKLGVMQVFVRVAELASFTKAAEYMGLQKGGISTAIQQLESQMGTRLLQRTTRKVQLTQDGQIYYERCKDLLAEVDEVDAMFQQASTPINGRLRVDMPINIARNLVIPNLPLFMSQHPDIQIELSSTDRRVDIITEGFDCLIRIGNLTDSGLIARSLGQLKLINCVSPRYIQKYGEPRSIDDLNQHFIVHYSLVLGSKSPTLEYFDGEKFAHIKMRASITVNSTDAYSAACLAGLGIVQVPIQGVKHHLDSGALIEILKGYQAEPMPISLIYPHRRHLPRRVQVFMDWLSRLMGQYLY
jgi:DNA-binding transcriptional LysR family regulator